MINIKLELDQEYTISGVGGRGDPYVSISGVRVYIKGAPRSLQRGARIHLKPDSFHIINDTLGEATYLDPRDYDRLKAAAPSPAQTTAPTSALEDQVSQEYHLYIGPTSQADRSAWARIPADSELLRMRAYDALLLLIRKHDDPSIYRSSTDRRIASDLYAIVQRAEKDKALDEVEFTLAGRPVTKNDDTPLSEYFTIQDTKKRSQSTVGRKKAGAGEEEENGNKPPHSPPRAQATQRRVGSPG